MPGIVRTALRTAAFLTCLFAPTVAHSATNNYLIVAHQSGLIEFLDPSSLKTVSSISVNVPVESTGLSGIFADPNGHTIYLEGPVGPNAMGANNCCWLYSIDLINLQAKTVAGIWGTSSRHKLVTAGRGILQPTNTWPEAKNHTLDDRWQVSPDGHGDGVAIPDLTQSSACSFADISQLIAASNRLLLYEVFGGKLDRRFRCPSVPGGVTVLDPSTGNVTATLASDQHFWTLVPNADGSEFFAITSEEESMQTPANLLRISAKTGKILQQRSLGSGYSWLVNAPLSSVPSGFVVVTLPAGG